MSLTSFPTPGKGSFAKRDRIPNLGQQHSLDSSRKSGGLSQLSTNSDGTLTRRKALASLNIAENVTVPNRDPFSKAGKIPGISGSNLSKTKRHNHEVPKSALHTELPRKDPFTKTAKIPEILGSDHGKTKRHDHDEPKTVVEKGLPTKDPFTKVAKIPGILGSESSKTKRHDHDEPKSVLESGLLSTKDPFTKAAKIPGILGSEYGTTKRHDHDEPKSVLDSGLLSTKDPFTKAAKIPGILGSEHGTTKRHDHDEPKSVLDSGLLSTMDPFTKAAKIPGILGSEHGKTKRHDQVVPSSGFDQGQQFPSDAGQASLQPAESLGKISTGSDGTLLRRKSLAPIGSGHDTEVISGDLSPKAVKTLGTVGSAAGHKKHKTQEMDIRKELGTRVTGDSVGVMGEEAFSYQSTDEEEFYLKHILAQEKLRNKGLQQHEVTELQQGQDVSTGVDKGTVGQTSKKTKKKDKKKGKTDKGKKKVTSSVWPNVTRGRKFEDMPYFRQIRMRYPNDPYHGLPPWAKFFPTPPGHEKMPIPEMYQGGATAFDMAAEYDRMYGAGGSSYGGGYEGMQYGQDVGDVYQGTYGGM
ncbi:uncharacterized protein LOC110448628 [Mizuhopecten yessoensis]|uniref:uncharacterized protein LOC110448628 n=1 Tax=Mizuhopecten yessoensis TaxID=6573 RepID=UPI000B45E28B|nr:uncharacterized protein LOC110448628 [Mizuhopecten yessoensis]